MTWNEEARASLDMAAAGEPDEWTSVLVVNGYLRAALDRIAEQEARIKELEQQIETERWNAARLMAKDKRIEELEAALRECAKAVRDGKPTNATRATE